MCVFKPKLYCFNYYSFVIDFEIRGHDTSSFVLLSQDYFGYLGSFVVPYKFRIVCPALLKMPWEF